MIYLLLLFRVILLLTIINYGCCYYHHHHSYQLRRHTTISFPNRQQQQHPQQNHKRIVLRIQQQHPQSKQQVLLLQQNRDASNTKLHVGKVQEVEENNTDNNNDSTIWERMAYYFITLQYNNENTNTNLKTDNINIGKSMDNDHVHIGVPSSSTTTTIQEFLSSNTTPSNQLYDYTQYISILRVILPSILYATTAKFLYPIIVMIIVSYLLPLTSSTTNNSGVYAVVAQDASQFIQNICTTSGLVFSILIGQTYYFMYQQQEKLYYALYDEVAIAKMVLEQVSLISRGRQQLYTTLLQQMHRYVQDDLQCIHSNNNLDPATILSSRPCDDPLEDILYLTSVGEPSQLYTSIRSLRQARSYRLGSLQMKLPELQMTLLWILAGIVLFVFPLLGAGSQTIGGQEIVQVQSYYFSILVFGISLVMNIIYELRSSSNQSGAYNTQTVLQIMIRGLQEEIQQRLQQPDQSMSSSSFTSSFLPITLDDDSPSIDGDGYF